MSTLSSLFCYVPLELHIANNLEILLLWTILFLMHSFSRGFSNQLSECHIETIVENDYISVSLSLSHLYM